MALLVEASASCRVLEDDLATQRYRARVAGEGQIGTVEVGRSGNEVGRRCRTGLADRANVVERSTDELRMIQRVQQDCAEFK